MKKLNIVLTFVWLVILCISCSESVHSLKTTNAVVTDILSEDTVNMMNPSLERTESSRPSKYIYLTIDDAPLNGCDYIDSVIAAMKIKANIFLVGNPIDGSHRFRKYHDLIKENQYIEIYNHSYSHAKNRYADYYKNPQNVLLDFEKNQTAFNLTHKIARLPGRNLWQIGDRKKNYRQTGATSAGLLADNGYQIFGWDVEWNYNAKDNTPVQTIDELVEQIEEMMNNSASFTSNHIVLLMHNQMFGKKNDKNDLEELIKLLKKNNYRFEYLSKYPI